MKGMGNLNKLMKQAQDMQAKMARVQEDLDGMEVEAAAGGGAVTVSMSGKMEVKRIKINPEVVETAGEWEYEEGCLSVPDRYWELNRPAFSRVAALDLNGDPVEYAGDGLLGRVLQHEVDHLDGLLLLDRLSKRVRKGALKELREQALGL